MYSMEKLRETMKKMRKPASAAEKDFAERCYQIGMRNGWCSGQVAREEGDFIVEEDRLNRNSFSVIDGGDADTLKAFFRVGNWCLGQAVLYKNLCFIQQVDGGDEWLTIKDFEGGAISFESISFQHILDEHGEDGDKNFDDYLARLLVASKEACLKLTY